MNREDRRRRTLVKLAQRKHLATELGLQVGIVYQRHVAKVQYSLGYMRSGNVSHYVSISPSRKTRRRNRYGKVLTPSRQDATIVARMDDQLNEPTE